MTHSPRRSRTFTSLPFVSWILVTSTLLGLSACGSEPGAIEDASSGGAATGGQESPGSGGLSASGGQSPSGGQASSGGTLSSGGSLGSGGRASGGAPPGVGGQESPSGGATASGGATSEPENPSKCDGTLPAGDSNRTVQVDGMSRKFILHVPAGYSGQDEIPLVIDFHPLGGTGASEKSGSGFAALSDQDGFIVLWPDGLDNAWNVGPCCTNSRDVDDVGFARAMVDDLVSVACIDQKRIYATGFSMGGGMSHYLACHAADVFAAVAPSAFDLLEENVEGCMPSRPISVFSMRGTNDTVAPYNGGPGSSGRATFLGAQKTFEKWGEIDGCTGEPTVNGSTHMFTTCAEGVEVGLLIIQGGSHAWGPSDVAWDFLKSKSLP